MKDKRTQIINAAIEVFAKQGLEKGKIADIQYLKMVVQLTPLTGST